MEELVGKEGFEGGKGKVSELYRAIPEQHRALAAAALERAKEAAKAQVKLQQQIEEFGAAVGEMEELVGKEGFEGGKGKVSELYRAIPEQHRALVAAALERAKEANKRQSTL
jgi:dihydrodipicolinate synthase/N-acetylneuraminate lyase